MNTIKRYATIVLHWILFYVQDFDGLKQKLYLASRSWNRVRTTDGLYHTVRVEGLEGEWIVMTMHDCWHHNPKITVGQDQGEFFALHTVRLSKVIL